MLGHNKHFHVANKHFPHKRQIWQGTEPWISDDVTDQLSHAREDGDLETLPAIIRLLKHNFTSQFLLTFAGSRGSSTIAFFPEVELTWLGCTKNSRIIQLEHVVREGCFINLCILARLNHPSWRPNCTCCWKTLQSLLAWEKELFHFQYSCCFISSSGGVCDN